ncbi:uncharacterized protein LOC121870920 [Homarus americanus]|uniref:Uncharacterized protein n=1 Tax=Homarus americanus TaxID=6706 RepID=A0A8J5JVF7_HOMAM|nr:uncharacterized protein LOC121870920 [Homarus americanus]KAG7165152.1 hypothetical protein Hamer_G004937 [Homarus americanus]
MMYSGVATFWLLLGVLSWSTCEPVGAPGHRTQTLAQHYASVASYPFSKIVGVFSVLDEDSCACLLFYKSCSLEISLQSVIKARGFPCPLLMRYCCRRMTLLDMSSTFRNEFTSPLGERLADINSVSHYLTSVLGEHKPYAKNSSTIPTATSQQIRSDKSGLRPSALDTPVFQFRASRASEVQSRERMAPFFPSRHSQGTDLDEDPSETPATAFPDVGQQTKIYNNNNEFKQQTETLPSDAFKREADFPRRSKMMACSCTTREDCTLSWSFFSDLPQVKIRTSLECRGPEEVTCCLGRVLPPHSHKSRKEGHPRSPSTSSVWRPLEEAWDSIISWFQG